jgi:hypothetical protein
MKLWNWEIMADILRILFAGMKLRHKTFPVISNIIQEEENK